MNGRILKGAVALSLGAALTACGGDETPELVNPIPGTSIQLVTEDGLNHGPAQLVTLENAGSLAVPVGETILLRALVEFADGYSTEVTEHTYFQVSGGGINLSPRTDDGVPATGAAEGTAQVTLILGSLDQPTIDVEVTPALLKELAITTPETSVPRNGSLPLTLRGTYGDGSTRDVTTSASWSSSNETVATVTGAGIVDGLSDGVATISAALDGVSTSTDLTVLCAYPNAGDTVRPFQTLPRISFSNVVFPDGTSGPFDLESVYCRDAGFESYDVIFFQLSAEWCGPCRAARNTFSANQAAFTDNNVLPVFLELENLQGLQNVTSVMANDSMSRELPDGFGIRAGDFDAEPRNIFYRSYAAREFTAFPTMVVVRVRDMQVIATSADQYSEFYQAYPDVFANPEWNWEDLTDPVPEFASQCQPGQDEMFEPNDTAAMATEIGATVVQGGICTEGDDFYRINVNGRVRITLLFSHDTGDLDMEAWNEATNTPILQGGQPVGSASRNDNESFEYTAPMMLRVYGNRGASAPYQLYVEQI